MFFISEAKNIIFDMADFAFLIAEKEKLTIAYIFKSGRGFTTTYDNEKSWESGKKFFESFLKRYTRCKNGKRAK